MISLLLLCRLKKEEESINYSFNLKDFTFYYSRMIRSFGEMTLSVVLLLCHHLEKFIHKHSILLQANFHERWSALVLGVRTSQAKLSLIMMSELRSFKIKWPPVRLELDSPCWTSLFKWIQPIYTSWLRLTWARLVWPIWAKILFKLGFIY